MCYHSKQYATASYGCHREYFASVSTWEASDLFCPVICLSHLVPWLRNYVTGYRHLIADRHTQWCHDRLCWVLFWQTRSVCFIMNASTWKFLISPNMTVYVYKLHEVVWSVYFVSCLSNSLINDQKYNKQRCTSQSPVLSTFFLTYNENLLASLLFSFIDIPINSKLTSFPGDVNMKSGHLHEE